MHKNPDWQLAQKHELNIWEATSKSAWRVLSELYESGELQSFVESKIGAIDVEGKKILEIGVGPLGIGWIGLFGSKNKESNIAIEPLPILNVNSELPGLDEFVKYLQGRVTIAGAKAENLEFPPESFDIVVCNDVMDHVLDYNSVLQKGFKALKKGGLFILSVNVFSALGAIKWNNYTRVRYADSANVICHLHSFTYPGICKVLEGHGFVMRHSNGSDFAGWHRFFGRSKKARFLYTKI